MRQSSQGVPSFDQGQAVRADFVIAILNLLHHGRHADLKKFVEIAGRDGQKLEPFELRIVLILCFLQHTPVKGKPGSIAIEVIRWIVE